jgi:hypothetical protein
MMLKIEKGVPTPSKRRAWKHPFVYDMSPGDSVVDHDARSTAESKIYDTLRQYAARNGFSVAGRQVDGGVRIWLLSND